MKFQLSATLMGIAATTVSAQENQSGPFTLHIKGTSYNSKIDGYGISCHAGAAISGLCYSEGALSNTSDISNSYKYNFNYTGFTQVGEDEVGSLVWNQPSVKAHSPVKITPGKFLAAKKCSHMIFKIVITDVECWQYTDQDGNPASVSQAMSLVYQGTSNVAAPLFSFDQSLFLVGFDSEGGLFGYNYVNDGRFVAGQPPTDYTPKAYYQWAVCWQYFTGYFYQSVAWVQLGVPHNPTCEAVEITKVDI
ncbi:hypothetical protein EKO27_g3387 [Xylaria grammica]|uniref:Peptidase A1 domain-containing protein n=1 Tax=Xylaria grammica TaxID=363999 RepID=A0A439DBD0_9PEZI|nr:hypothetical protein EKO27_g3387 [Xylaria grammica]